MRTHLSKIFVVFLTFFMLSQNDLLEAQVRIKDIASVENAKRTSLIGYGLVVGLNGTGDRSGGSRGSVFTVQSISNMLERFGITVPNYNLRTRNVAAVMVTAEMPPFGSAGSQFDVTVSSLGDATSLEGGILLMTPLQDPMGQLYGMAQGPLSIGGFNIETPFGERVRKNHALVGRIPAGGYLSVNPAQQQLDLNRPVRLFLTDPDFVTAQRIVEAINLYHSEAEWDVARPIGPGVVELFYPDSNITQAMAIGFIAAVETLMVQTDSEARVVINERTGTIVAGGNVTIDEVMISHGNLTIHTRSAPVISQPQAFSSTGTTVLTRVTETQVEEGQTQSAVIQQTTTVSELAKALNTLGLKPRDIIAIFQAIKQAGALRAKLIIN